eukprot:SAG31_NODE_3321_length_4417_cov_2.056508_1_plen_55_part_10
MVQPRIADYQVSCLHIHIHRVGLLRHRPSERLRQLLIDFKILAPLHAVTTRTLPV